VFGVCALWQSVLGASTLWSNLRLAQQCGVLWETSLPLVYLAHTFGFDCTTMALRIMSMCCRSSRALLGTLLLLVLVLLVQGNSAATATAGATTASIVSTSSDARISWPASLLKVVTDCESARNNQDNAELQSTIATACWLTSRSVTASQRAVMLQRILQLGDQDESTTPRATAVALVRAVATSGLCVLQPSSSSMLDAVTAAGCCQGTILYYPDSVDLQRGEGLLDTLAPVMERLLVSSSSSSLAEKSNLYVVVPDGVDQSTVREVLEQAMAAILPSLLRSNNEKVTSLNDVFASIKYVTPEMAATSIQQDASWTPADIKAHLALVTSSSSSSADLSSSSSSTDGGGLAQVAAWGIAAATAAASTGTTTASTATQLPPLDLAVAQALGPVVQAQVAETLTICRDAVTTDESGTAATTQLVVQFGALCDAAIAQALQTLDQNVALAPFWSSSFGQTMRAQMLADIEHEVSDLVQNQIDLLRLATFEQFKKNLSKLLVSPNLQSDMEAVARQSMASFAVASAKLLPKKLKTATVAAAHTEPSTRQLARQMSTYISNRILTARASGKFAPLPRKGVTVGLHWLLPKPFGNDYRQEPWMVHATDNLVYVPPHSKLADVAPDSVASGDWRDKIVPSPPGNDMLYLQ
jgi:hypothetical protein